MINMRRPLLLILVLLMSAAALSAAWAYVLSVGRAAFEADILKVKQSFFEGVKAAESAVQSVESFSEAIGTIDQERFGRFTADLMTKSPFLMGVIYYQRVADAGRLEYEAELRGKGIGETILEGGVGDSPDIRPAKVGNEYFAVTAVDAGAREASYFGWNALTDPNKDVAIKKLLSVGEPVASGAFLLDNGNIAIEIFAPVRNRDAAIVGVIGATVDLTRLLGDERWREGVTIVMTTVLAGESIAKDIYRYLDRSEAAWPNLGSITSKIELDRFGQQLGLKFEKQLYPGRVNLTIIWLTLAACLLLALLGSYLLLTYEKLQKSLAGLAEANSSLERRVNERTLDLKLAHAEVKEILDNLDDLVVTVDPEMKIGATHSPASLRLLGRDAIVGCSLTDVLFKDLDRHDANQGKHLFVMEMLRHSDPFQWSISTHDLMPVLRYKSSETSAERTLSLRYSPIFENDVFRKMIVVASDVTEILALRASLAAREKESTLRETVLLEIAASDKRQLRGFFKEFEARMEEIRTFSLQPDPQATLPILRSLHTIKGTARSVGLKLLAKCVHAVEDQLEPLRLTLMGSNSEHVDFEASVRSSGFTEIHSVYTAYHRIFVELFTDTESSPLAPRFISRLGNFLGSVKTDRKELANWFEMSQNEEVLSVVEIFEGFFPTLQELAGELGKELIFETPQWDLYIAGSLKSALQEAFTHVLRNAIDHGIEDPEERTSSGKPSKGKLWLTFEDRIQHTLLTICDDGRGINLKKVYDLAQSKQLVNQPFADMHENQILDLLFAPGFSTKTEISELSGRGVGLDAVRVALKRCGVECRFSSKTGHGSYFEMLIPRSALRFVATPEAELRMIS